MKAKIKYLLLGLLVVSNLTSCESFFDSFKPDYESSYLGTEMKFLIGKSKEYALGAVRGTPQLKSGHVYTYAYYKERQEKRYIPGLSRTITSYNPDYDMLHTYEYQVIPDRIENVNVQDYRIVMLDIQNNKVAGVYYKGNTGFKLNSDNERVYKDYHCYDKINYCAKYDNLTEYKKLLNQDNMATSDTMLLYAGLEAAKANAPRILEYLVKEKGVNPDEPCDTWAYGEEYNYVLVSATIRQIATEKGNRKILQVLKE